MFTDNERARLAVGLKETKKAVSAGAEKVFLAEDTPEHIAEEIKAIAGDRLCMVSTMRELGVLCGIDVKASCAAIRS